MLMRSYKKVFSGFLPLGEVKVVRDRWQMVGSSVVWPELRLSSAVIIRDLTKEAGFTTRTITSANLDPDDIRYVFERAFAGVRIADFNQMNVVSTHDICERLSWRSQFRLNGDNRNVAAHALGSFIDKSTEGIYLADGIIGFKPYVKNSYVVNLTSGRQIPGFKVPLVGHGWSCMLEHERPRHLHGIVFNSHLKEVPGSSGAAL